MPDDYDRKPPRPDEDDDGLYELAEDPDAGQPESQPPPPGVGEPSQGDGSADAPRSRPSPRDIDPMADDPGPSTGAGGEGGASHFSGEDPEYVNPEIARMRREEQRKAAALAEAEAAARKQKLIFGVLAGLVVLAVVLYFVIF